jgi:hypothetical protein
MVRSIYGRIASAIIAAVIPLAIMASSVSAAPAEQACAPDAFFQHDMAGVYLSQQHMMRLTVYPCGVSHLQWANQYGEHSAAYYSTVRLPGGGIGAYKAPVSVESLDATNVIGFKPGVPGHIEVFTVNDYGGVVGVYTLRKTY